MTNRGIVSETQILVSMLDRIIVDDLLQERELEIFEQKKKWHDRWRRKIIKTYRLESGLLEWDQLKEWVVEWLRDDKSSFGREVIMQLCLSFEPYDEMQGIIQASPEARELSLEKICRLLGLEDKWQELFPSQCV